MTAERRLLACFERGKQAAKDRNYPYAHELFSICVSQAPGNLQFAEMLLSNLKASFGPDRKKTGHLLGLKGAKDFKKAVADQQWQEAIRLCAAILGSDPWDVSTLRGMAEACEALHHNEVELVYLKQALDAAPKDCEVNRHCARSLARMGQFDQAIACWHRVEEIRGKDTEAAEMVLRLTQEKMQYPGGKPPEAAKPAPATPEASSEDSKPPEPENASKSKPDHIEVEPETPRQRLERLISADPGDVRNYLKLADLLCDNHLFDDADHCLHKAKRHCAQTTLVEGALQKVLAVRHAHQQAEEELRKKHAKANTKIERGFPWLEVLLTMAGVALILQVVPGLWDAVMAQIQLVLIILNVFVVLALVGWQVWAKRAK